MLTDDDFGSLAGLPVRWVGVLTTGDTLEVLTDGYSIEDGHYVFSLLFKGKPNFEMTTLLMPAGLDSDQPWQSLPVRELMPTDDGFGSLAMPPEHWFVDLTTGDTLEVLMHGHSIEGERHVFSLLFKGKPNFEVAVLSIPSSLVKDIRKQPLKEYLGIVWIGEAPELRFTLLARDPMEARTLAKAKYGEHPMRVWNEEERRQIR